MKKLTAVLLVALMIIATLPINASAEAAETTEPDTFTVNAVSNLFTSDQATYCYTSTEGVPDTVTVTCYMDVDKALRLQAIHFEVNWDPDYLTFDSDKNGIFDEDYEEYDYSPMFPVSDGLGDINYRSYDNRIEFMAAKWDGLRLKKNDKLVPVATIIFDVVEGAKGATEVEAVVSACALTNPETEEDYVVYGADGLQQYAYDFVTGGDPSSFYTVIAPAGYKPIDPTTEEPTTEELTTEELTTEEPTTEELTTEEPTTEEPATEEPTTEEPTTEEVIPTTTQPAPVGDSLTVNAVSNLFTSDQATYYYTSTEGVPDTVTVTYFIDVDKALRLQSTKFAVNWDPDYLTFDPDKNGIYNEASGEYDYSPMFPVAGSLGNILKRSNDNQLVFLASKFDGLSLKKNDEPVPVASIIFDVVEGAKGVTEVEAAVKICALTNPETEEDYFVCSAGSLEQSAYDFVTGGDPSKIYSVIAPAGNIPIEPTTEEPTEALIGDINNDGTVDILDATAVQKYTVEKITLTDKQKDIADVNDDGTVDILDAIMIQKYAVEKITEFNKKA